LAVLQIIPTLDYEIHGNGDGCPQQLMVEPTYRLLSLCERYGAKLSIMADVAEILKFKEYKETYGHDRYGYDSIAEQLRFAVGRGHDVQLHIHSSYFNAKHDGRGWIQDWSEYNFAGLPYERMAWMVGTCKQFLETLLQPANPDYRCRAFRAANWSVTPSVSVVRTLVESGIEIDSSVFKYGRRRGIVAFDYSRANSPIVPWRVKEDDICCRDDTGALWELPIYSENRWIGAFLTFSRLYHTVASRRHKISGPPFGEASKRGDANAGSAGVRLPPIFRKHAWKADLNQCNGGQLIRAAERAAQLYAADREEPLPFVLIGHSKLYAKWNDRSLAPFFSYCAERPDKFEFTTFLSWKPWGP
jgi:hypothetical protein